jgi:hypothetical protein
MKLRKRLSGLLGSAAVLGLTCVSPVLAEGVEGRFYPEKEIYVLGEPIFVVFELLNKSGNSLEVWTATAHGDCALVQGLQVEIMTVEPVRLGPAGCPWGFAGSCLGGLVRLEPGEKHKRRHLLNDYYEFPSRALIACS